jgi:hypothetical protein
LLRDEGLTHLLKQLLDICCCMKCLQGEVLETVSVDATYGCSHLPLGIYAFQFGCCCQPDLVGPLREGHVLREQRDHGYELFHLLMLTLFATWGAAGAWCEAIGTHERFCCCSRVRPDCCRMARGFC